MVISPLGGVVYSFYWRILKGWPQVCIHALLKSFAYLQPFSSYSTFSVWLGFPYCQRNCGVFEENDPQKVKISKNTCLEGTSLRQTASFELSCVKIGSRVRPVHVAKNKKTKKIIIIIIKVTQPLKITIAWGRHRWSDHNQIWHGCRALWKRYPRKIWSQSIHNCDFGKGLKLPFFDHFSTTSNVAINTAVPCRAACDRPKCNKYN